MKEILENLWQVGGGDLTGGGDAAVYLVRFGDRAALIDAGTGSRPTALRDNIAECLPEEVSLEYLFLTHCHFDHAGGAEAVRNAFGCQIVAHELDAGYLESGDSEVTAASWYGTRMQPLPVDARLKGWDQRMWERHLAAIRFPKGLHIRGRMPLPLENRKLNCKEKLDARARPVF